MNTFTSVELFALADRYEKQIEDPKNLDDPKWLRRWADKIRRLAVKKEQAVVHKKAKRRSASIAKRSDDNTTNA